MATEFTTGKSILILAVVAGCFAILWPNIFYPMLLGSYPVKNSPSPDQGGCCDVIFDNDVEAIKVMTDLCERILLSNPDPEIRLKITINTGKMNTALAEACREAVWQKCRVDITQIFTSKSGLNRSYKQFVEELRSLNSSICLKQAFGVSYGPIGLPRTIRIWGLNRPKHLRQERPPHLRPEFLHPALREKGRAIPHSHIVPKIDGRQSTPMPGMRPPMGGAGHVVPPPKGSGTMGIVMPMYTIGIVVFFLYTMIKLMFKKSDSNSGYNTFTSDPDFQRAVFGDYNYSSNDEVVEHPTKLVVSAITGLVQEVNKQIRLEEIQATVEEEKDDAFKEIEEACETKEKESNSKFPQASAAASIDTSQDKGGIVKVVGYEMTERSSSGGKYSRPPTPSSRPPTPASRPPTPQSLYLPNLLPPQSQLIVSQEETQALPSDDSEEPVVLSAKVTLSLIGLPEREIIEPAECDSDDSLKNQQKLDAECKERNKINDKDKDAKENDEDIHKWEENSKPDDYQNAIDEKEETIDDCLGPTQLNQEMHINSSEM